MTNPTFAIATMTLCQTQDLYKVEGSSITSTKIEIFWIWKLFQKAVIKSSAKMVTNPCISASFLSKMRSQKKSTGKLSNVKLLQEQVILNNNNSQNFFPCTHNNNFLLLILTDNHSNLGEQFITVKLWHKDLMLTLEIWFEISRSGPPKLKLAPVASRATPATPKTY